MHVFSVFAFIFDIDGTLVDSNDLHVDSWDRAFRRFGKQFPLEKLRAQIGKGSDQYLPEFLTPDEIEHFGMELDDYRSGLFRKEYLPAVRPFPKVRELLHRIRLLRQTIEKLDELLRLLESTRDHLSHSESQRIHHEISKMRATLLREQSLKKRH